MAEAGRPGLLINKKIWAPGDILKTLWERFSTAISPVGTASAIVVKNHSHQSLSLS